MAFRDDKAHAALAVFGISERGCVLSGSALSIWISSPTFGGVLHVGI